MRFWRFLLILALLAALGLLALVTILHLSPWQWVRSALPESVSRAHAAGDVNPPVSVAPLGALLTLYASGVLLMYLFPQRVWAVSQAYVAGPISLLRLGALGLVLALAAAVVTIGSVFSMGTFVLTFFLGSVLFFSILFGNVGLAYRLGRALLDRAGLAGGRLPLVALAVGVVLLFAVINIPWVGPLFFFIFASLGLGAAIFTHFGTGRPWNLTPLIEEGLE